LGSNPESKGVIQELRALVPGLRVTGVAETLESDGSVFDTVVTSHFDALFGRYQFVNTAELAMTPELYRQVAPFEGQALNMLDRVKYHSLHEYPPPIYGIPRYRDGYDSRTDLFFRHCRFWHYVFTEFHIDAVIAQNFGHQGFDFVALNLAKSLGIPTLIFNDTGQFPMVQFVQECVEDLGDLTLGKTIKSAISANLEPESDNFIRKSVWWIRQSPNRVLVPQETNKVGEQSLKSSVIDAWLKNSNVWKSEKLQFSEILLSLSQKFLRAVSNPKRTYSRGKSTLWRLRSTRKSIQEERAHSTSPIARGSYVYFPLHFQPEASSSVKGRNFYRLREAVAFLASGLPEGWELLVKEHPHQIRRLYPREPGFYSQIASIPRVKLMPHHHDNESLVAGARAVACVSHSSITAHAAVNGKTVISLGDSHFRQAPNYFCVASLEQLRHVLASIDNNHSRVEQSWETFLSDLESSTFEGVVGYRPPSLSEIEYQRIVRVTSRNLSLVIAEWLRLRGLVK
jgi:hypothetical protein